MFKSLIRFHSSNKIDNRGGKEGKKKKKKIQKNPQNKSKHKKNKCIFFLRHCCQSPFPPHLPGIPPTLCWSVDLLWGQLRFLSGLTPVCSCLQCPQLSELVPFLLWELSMSFYIFHRHRVCLVEHVDLICSLYSWWEGFGSSLKSTVPGFQLWFNFHLCMWVFHWGLFLRLPWKTWVCPCEGQVWKWCSTLNCRGSGSTRYSGGLAARAAGNTVL